MKPIENRKHHYVPQFILRNFASAKQEHLYAFDKWNDKCFKVNITDAAAEKGFYAFETSETKGCAEEFFADIEAKVSPLVHKIVNDQKLPKLNLHEHGSLAVLMVSQMLRSKNHRAITEQIGDMLRDPATSQGTPNFVKWVGEKNPEEEKQIAIMNVEEQVAEFSLALANKNAILYVSTPKLPLLIGDSPLTRMNTTNKSTIYGTLGLASLGIEIYLPLSPSVVLAFMCPTIAQKMRQIVLLEGRKAPEVAFEYLMALEVSRPLILEPHHVSFLNSQQVVESERFIYSGTDDFSLVYEMIRQHPFLRKGRRITSN